MAFASYISEISLLDAKPNCWKKSSSTRKLSYTFKTQTPQTAMAASGTWLAWQDFGIASPATPLTKVAQAVVRLPLNMENTAQNPVFRLQDSLRYFHSGLPQQGLSWPVIQCCPRCFLSCTHGSQVDFPPCVRGGTMGKAGRVYGSQVGALNHERGILDEKSSPWRKMKHPNRDSHDLLYIIRYVTWVICHLAF